MKSIRNKSGLIVLALFLLICAAGCKSKKKAMEANAAAEKARMEQEASRKRQQQEEETKRKQAEENARKEAEAEKAAQAEMEAKQKASAPKARLSQYFDAIAGSSSAASANNSISEALTLFASGTTPVLIVISESGGQKDYDKPTTINAYLNYLKDQKKNINRIEGLQFDGAGKITEVELKKN